MNFFNFSRPKTILNNLAAPVESENPFSLQELDKPNNDAFNAPTENVNNFNLPQKKGKFPSMTGDTDYAFPTSPDLSDNEYPDITSHFLDKKFSLYDGIAQRRASRDVADIRHYLSQGFDQGQEFDLTHDPKFPGIAEDGSPQYALLGGTKVNGSMLTHYLNGLGFGASGTDYRNLKLGSAITHPQAMISGLLAHQKGFEHEANSPVTSINRMQQAAAAQQSRLIASEPGNIRNPNAPMSDTREVDVYDPDINGKIGTYASNSEDGPTLKTGANYWIPKDPMYGKAQDDGLTTQVIGGTALGVYGALRAVPAVVRYAPEVINLGNRLLRRQSGRISGNKTSPDLPSGLPNSSPIEPSQYQVPERTGLRRNPFEKRTLNQTEDELIQAEWERKGDLNLPVKERKGAFVNPKTGRSVYLHRKDSGRFQEPNDHVDIHYNRDKREAMEKAIEWFNKNFGGNRPVKPKRQYDFKPDNKFEE